MQKYINMNDSFGGKNTVSSTKSFQTTYEQCIESLKQQVQNHKKALTMAQKLLEHYKQQNYCLIQQIQNLKEGKAHAQQKYEVLQKLFLKFDKQKEREIKKQSRRSQEKHLLQVETINSRYEGYLATLNQRVYLLENQLKKYHQKQKQWQQFETTLQRQLQKEYVNLQRKKRQSFADERTKKNLNSFNQLEYQSVGNKETLNQDCQHLKKQGDTNNFRPKHVNSSCGTRQSFDRATLGKKDTSAIKDKKVLKTMQFMRMSTQDDYHSNKKDMFKTVQKNTRIPATYDNFFTEYKHYK